MEDERSLVAEVAALAAFGPARAAEVVAVRAKEGVRGAPAGVVSPEPGTARRIRAAVPAPVLDRARSILHELESDAAPAFDLGYLVSRPGPLARDGLPARRAVSVRLAVLCERTGLDRARVRRWAYVAAVLSGLWELEDRRDGWGAALEMARIVALDL